MRLVKSMFSRQALHAAGLLLILSAVYELAYHGIFSLKLASGLQMGLFVFLFVACSLPLYALISWRSGLKPAWNRQALLRVLAAPAILLLVFYGLLTPLYLWALQAPWLLLVLELACAALLIFLGPALVCWDRAAAAGTPAMAALKEAAGSRTLLNGWCFLLLVRILADTLCAGILSLAGGINAYSLLSLTLFQGDPLASAALYGSAGLPGPALLFCLAACLYAWMLASWFGHGTH